MPNDVQYLCFNMKYILLYHFVIKRMLLKYEEVSKVQDGIVH